MVTCAICGQRFKAITNTHLRRHGTTLAEYASRWSPHLVSEEVRQPRSKHRIHWQDVSLGNKPDSVLARELGVTREVVKNARRRAGIPAFVGLILTQEGMPCRSVYEAMYDAYLHWQGLQHEHEVHIEDLPYVADFKVGDIYVEIVGMTRFVKYGIKYAHKRRCYEEAGVRVRWLQPMEVDALYRDCPVDLRFRSERRCLDCSKETHDLVKGVCRTCYMKRWHRTGVERACLWCGATFVWSGDRNRKYCSHACYARSLEFDWPSWEWIDEQLKTMSIRQLALRMGVQPSALYMRLRRRAK